MKVIILCGGDGIRLKNQSNYSPKGMVYLDDKPILWHIMKRYSLFGFNDFILALGKNGKSIRDFFLNYNTQNNDLSFTINNPREVNYLNQTQEEDWKITLVNTGEDAHTGSRVYRCKKYIDDEVFMVTYSDCLSDVNLDTLIKYHQKNKNIATVTGVRPPFRYGEFEIKGEKVINFSPTSKLSALQGYVNGGFMIFNRKIFNHLNTYNECTLEKEVFKNLTKLKRLEVYKHDHFWQTLDNDREYLYLRKLCQENKRYWLMK